jgi:hypothetical protein
MIRRKVIAVNSRKRVTRTFYRSTPGNMSLRSPFPLGTSLLIIDSTLAANGTTICCCDQTVVANRLVKGSRHPGAVSCDGGYIPAETRSHRVRLG